MKVLFFIITLMLVAAEVFAAPCCGGAGSVPALITGDESQNLSASLLMTSVVADAYSAGSGALPTFRNSNSASENKKVLTLNYARILDGDRIQAGLSVPIVQTDLKTAGLHDTNSGLGDVSMVLGYEALPEWVYSRLIPRVFLFSQLTLPTSKSIYESNTTLATDARGLNQWQFALGAAAVKRWSLTDFTLSGKLARVFGRDFESLDIGSSYDLMANVSFGVSPTERFRLGDSVGVDYQSPFSVSGEGVNVQTTQKLIWANTLSVTYLSGFDDSIVVSYLDQTLFGPAINASLSRGVSLAFVHRIER